MHKDHYENIYCVISGFKDFILIPPTDAPWIPYKNYPLASYRYDSSGEENSLKIQETSIMGNKTIRADDSLVDSLKENLDIDNNGNCCRKCAGKSCERFSIAPDPSSAKVPWISINPLDPDLQQYPGYGNAGAVSVRVNAGDALYLPSLWYHHVRQSHGCIAVNYWYDMEYGIKYNYHQMLQNLTWKSQFLHL